MRDRRRAPEPIAASTRSYPPRQSSHSGTNGNCVEVAADSVDRVLVRDTRDREGPVLAFRPGAWRWFARQVKTGALPG